MQIYRRPADRFSIGGKSAPRVRNFSMSCMMGLQDLGLANICHYGDQGKRQVQPGAQPGSIGYSILPDEQSDPNDLLGGSTSIDDGDFGVFTIGGPYWPNSPASRHGNGGTVSFADGRSEQWHWKEPTTARAKGLSAPGTPPVDRDVRRFQAACYAEGAYR